LPVRKLYNPRGKKSKGQTRRESQWLRLSEQAQSQPMAEISTTAKANKMRELDDLPSRKGKKRNIPLMMMMMFKGYLMS